MTDIRDRAADVLAGWPLGSGYEATTILYDDAREMADALAAAGLLRDDGSDDDAHIIDFREHGWTIKHPLSCRPYLFDCPVNRYAEEFLTEPPETLGRFECWIDDDGEFRISAEPVEELHQ